MGSEKIEEVKSSIYRETDRVIRGSFENQGHEIAVRVKGKTDDRVPPPGWICSFRLGRIEPLL